MNNKYIPLPETMTIGERYNPAMEMTDTADAQAYLEALIEHDMRVWGQTEDEARRIQLSNLGYYTGYYDYETRQRVQALFGAVHPVFGMTQPTPEEALQAGIDRAKGKP